MWSWCFNTLVTWCKELTHLKRLWCWERLKAGGEGDDRGWDGWMASTTQWTWVWVNSGNWWWTGRPGVLQSMGSQRVGHDWVTELNWTPGFRVHLCHLLPMWSWTNYCLSVQLLLHFQPRKMTCTLQCCCFTPNVIYTHIYVMLCNYILRLYMIWYYTLYDTVLFHYILRLYYIYYVL